MGANGKPKLCWVDRFGADSAANVLGYATHTAFMKKYSQPYIDFDIAAPVTLCITIADKFQPLPGRFNVLFSMWEFNDLPKPFIDGINKADAIIVPSSFCRDLFARYTKKPIYVCWEGIEPENFPYVERKIPNVKYGERFRYLWVGAPNPRKGYISVLEAVKLIEQTPQLEMYIKTTAPKKTPWHKYLPILWRRISNVLAHKTPRDIKELKQSVKIMMSPKLADRLNYYGKHKNIIVDTRKLPLDELRALYQSAHCFVLPTLGEGWGLTLCEAMSTGCPCIATNVTGVTEFFNSEFGYEIKYTVKDIPNGDFRDYPNFGTTGYFPDTKDFIEKMLHVYGNYADALKRGRRASAHIQNKYTWDKAGRRLATILEDIYAKHAPR